MNGFDAEESFWWSKREQPAQQAGNVGMKITWMRTQRGFLNEISLKFITN